MKFEKDFSGVAEAKTVTKDATGKVTKEEKKVPKVSKAPQAEKFLKQVEEKKKKLAARPPPSYKRTVLDLDPKEVEELKASV